MIAAFLYAALLTAYKPFVLSWSVNWGGDRLPTTHSHAFETAEDAIDMLGKAPMCSEAKPPPCVIWTNLSFATPSEDKEIGDHHAYSHTNR